MELPEDPTSARAPAPCSRTMLTVNSRVETSVPTRGGGPSTRGVGPEKWIVRVKEGIMKGWLAPPKKMKIGYIHCDNNWIHTMSSTRYLRIIETSIIFNNHRYSTKSYTFLCDFTAPSPQKMKTNDTPMETERLEPQINWRFGTSIGRFLGYPN